MAGKQMLNSSPLELAIQRELAYRNQGAVTTQTRTPSFKKWTYTGTVSNASALGYLSFSDEEPHPPEVQSSAETPRLLLSSSQNQMVQSPKKDEPYSAEPSNEKPHSHNSSKPTLIRPSPKPDQIQGTNNTARFQSRPPNPKSPTTSAFNDWVGGPSKLPGRKLHTPSNSSYLAPLRNERNTPPLRARQIHGTNNTARFQPRSPNPRTPTTSALNDWVGGPSKLLGEKPHNPPRNSSHMVPLGSERNTRPPIQGTNNTDRFQPRSLSLIPFQRPITDSRSAGLKRKAIEIYNYNYKTCVDSLVCELCQASCSSARTMQQHLRGRPHRANLEWSKLVNSNNNNNKPMCNICQIWCPDRNALEMHLRGKKHKAKLEESEARKRNGSSVLDKKPIFCELCGVFSMNASFESHLMGKQHAIRLQLSGTPMLLN